MVRVGLVMIVRDEEKNIERALRSAIPFISTWVIVDTGSVDKTKEIINSVMDDVSGSKWRKGTLYERPWVGFGHNRTEALTLCKGKMDFAIMLDADDTLEGTVLPQKVWSHEMIDGYKMKIVHGTVIHSRVQIFRVDSNWVYEGVIHEFPVCKKPNHIIAELPGEMYMSTRCEGFRSRDPNKYKNDAIVLQAEYDKNPLDSRTVFYLAQSYRDANMHEPAIEYYGKYLDLSNTWIQERYMSYVNIIAMTRNNVLRMKYAWKAVNLLPERLEAQCYALKHMREQGCTACTQQMYALAIVTKNRTPNMSDLFVNAPVYEWGMDDELGIIAARTGHYEEAAEAFERAAKTGPPEFRDKAIHNAKVSRELLKQHLESKKKPV